MKDPFGLALREVGPEPYRYDYATVDDYIAAWRYWRAVRRDAYPTTAELESRLVAMVEAFRARHGHDPIGPRAPKRRRRPA